MELLEGAEERVEIGAHGEIRDGEVANDANAETDTGDGGRNGVVFEVEKDVAHGVLAEEKITADCK